MNKKASTNNAVKCDICSSHTPASHTYALQTKTVVTNSEYWTKTIKLAEKKGLRIPTTPLEILQLVVQVAGQKSMWIVCDNCAAIYQFDRIIAQQVAQTWWRERTPVACSPLCSLPENSQRINYNEKEAFDLAYSNARETFCNYWFQQYSQFLANHAPTPVNFRKAMGIFSVIEACSADLREGGNFG